MPNIKSNISFGLVNIPVLLNPVVHNNDISFNQIHKKCGNRISYVKFCSHCKREVKNIDIVKGYEFQKGDFFLFSSKELNDLKPENAGEIEIVSFIPFKEVDPSYFEKTYKLSTEKKSKAYQLLVKALIKTNMVGLCKTVMHNKFYYGILRFYESSLLLSTLYFEEEMNFSTNMESVKLETKELDLAVKLVESLKGHFEPEKYRDIYQEKIREAIEAKKKGIKVKKVKKSPKKEVDDLMKALEMSLKK